MLNAVSPALPDLTLTNARIVLPDGVAHGALQVRDGRITAIERATENAPGHATDSPPDGGVLDCAGDLLIPGLIELHTDNLERHMQPRPGVDWPHMAAILAHDAELASTGITTVFDAMRVGSILATGQNRYRAYARALSQELLSIRAAGLLKISHFLHLRAEVCSETLTEELEAFAPEDRVGILSIMDHTPGQRQFRDLEKFRHYVRGKHGLTEAQLADHVAHLTATRARLGAAHEAAAVAHARRLGAVLASHDDTTAAQVGVSHGHGVRLAEFPTTREAAEACRAGDIAVMMGAPNLIRGGSHSGNVAAGDLARSGLLDILSSDYVPSSLLTAAFRLADLWDDLPRAIRTVTAAPAEAAGLTDRGRIAPGLLADLVRVHTEAAVPVVRGVWSHGRQVA
ncbi:alpha-D-ribose 1-methylphosphonate 5-triphosphate diphosphatase [Marinovum sp.]|uniref:alpha-D-ribose 1-methylphosphonate 5-triphosphate diphosphatase n=1 Tax=Marinovum sp. TaxID=2024839 RepID=UPI002B27B3D5|nr:alpha-D-ribose 1-methylphosphonate 5-triphosphate diphosphatase [Marinovum sp.]